MKKKITKKMKFAELVKNYPDAGEVLMEKGMFCIGCPAAAGETIEEGASAHGMNAGDLIKELNEKLKS
jgi:hybrid cluster-associated redox disulfide protein